MAEYQHIRVDRTDDVVRITMDRAARRNSLSAEHLAELLTAFREVAASDAVGVVLAALLFGALYQGGNELQYVVPGLTRELVVVIQALVILFTGAMELVANLAKAQVDGRFEERLTHYAKPKLLIVDELGYLPLEPDAAHLFFQLVSRRYEAGAMLITSNRSVAEWGTVFAGPAATARRREGTLAGPAAAAGHAPRARPPRCRARPPANGAARLAKAHGADVAPPVHRPLILR